jgi:hypothetical protein
MAIAPGRLVCIIMLWCVFTGCDNAAEQGIPHVAADTPGESATDAERGHADHGTEHLHSNEEALPLLPIMMRMAADMAGFMQALWLEDYEAMTRHATGVSAHPNISAAELERIESILGTATAAFEDADEEVHEASVRMREAAEARDMNAILEHLAAVQSGCVGCHTRFRERLRTTR